MAKSFNTNGPCFEDIHYMVNMDSRVEDIIHNLVDKNKYFVINRPRQFGKTTLFDCLFRNLKEKYIVFWISFEGMGSLAFSDECLFCRGFLRLLQQQVAYGITEGIPDSVSAALNTGIEDEHFNILMLKDFMIHMCMNSDKQIVLMIDEVDKASNNQVFLDFLSVLRNMYLSRRYVRTFHSVILAGVYDIKNLKTKIRPDDEKRYNSPWNVAADFMVDMSFNVEDIMGMLQMYEAEHHTGMDIPDISQMLWDYTEGYPFMVSRICQILDEQTVEKEFSSHWSRTGILSAVNHLLSERNTLFDDMNKKIADSASLSKMLRMILFHGKKIPYNPDDYDISLGTMFGYLKNKDKNVAVSNRIFETRLYNVFLSEHIMEEAMFDAADLEKDTFVHHGVLDMESVMRKFMEYFTEIYADSDDKFLEENGRRIFLLYLRPILNGVGNYYVEARTRNMRRTDVVIDYHGRQYVVEMKIWHGREYQQRGELQLAGYLEDYHLTKGYLLSFNFNKNKKVGMKKIHCNGKVIVEVVV